MEEPVVATLTALLGAASIALPNLLHAAKTCVCNQPR